MSNYRVPKEARDDLDEIWLFIARDNPDAADRFVGLLVSKFPILGANPFLGRPRSDLAPGIRSLAVGDYLIFYRPRHDGIDIVRVLHGARDLPPLLR